MIFYTNSLIPGEAKALTLGLIILVRPDLPAAETKQLIAHEQCHVRQFKADPFRFHYRYLTSDKWRMKYEGEAFAAQAQAGAPIEGLASYFARSYRLNLTPEKARWVIESYYHVLNDFHNKAK